MNEYKYEIYLLIILLLVIIASLAPFINAAINSKEECVKEGGITICPNNLNLTTQPPSRAKE